MLTEFNISRIHQMFSGFYATVSAALTGTPVTLDNLARRLNRQFY